MRIPSPPISIPPHNISNLQIKELECLCQIRHYFRDQDFDDRYFSQFDWFREVLPSTESILDLGCGNGREAFALGWEMGAGTVVGVDLDDDKIRYAYEVTQCIDSYRHRFPTHYADQVRDWYKGMPHRIKAGILPKFLKMDASQGLPWSDNGFGLVYCRYTLWQIADRSLDDLRSTCQSMAEAVNPESGRVVIVEPSKKEGFEYDFVECLQDVGLALCAKEEDRNGLGWLEPFKRETDPIDPKGYIFAKLTSVNAKAG
ncbi:class I SAM-dependent methyltransferase [Chloroflexota bacterium]